MRYFYRDFVTGKRKFTRKPFIGWTHAGGPLNVRYAIFSSGTNFDILVPPYSLCPETLRQLDGESKANLHHLTTEGGK